MGSRNFEVIKSLAFAYYYNINFGGVSLQGSKTASHHVEYLTFENFLFGKMLLAEENDEVKIISNVINVSNYDELEKLAKLEEQQLAAAASESAAAATQAAAERMTATANERIAAVSAVFKKMANLDEGLEGDCTCLQCMQALADPVLLQVMRRCVACHCF